MFKLRFWGLGLVFLAGTLMLPRSGSCAPASADSNLHTLKGSRFQYYLSLPNAWTPRKKWPILVNIVGSSHNFYEAFQGFISARKNRPFIILTPCFSSNGRDPNEEAALYGMVREAQNKDHGASKFFMTGFSAGGHLTYKVILSHPEMLAGAAPTSTGYLGRTLSEISTSPARVHLPIRSFLGSQDPDFVLYTAHWNAFVNAARAHGYQHIEHVVVQNHGHSPYAVQVVAFFASLLHK